MNYQVTEILFYITLTISTIVALSYVILTKDFDMGPEEEEDEWD